VTAVYEKLSYALDYLKCRFRLLID